MKCQKTTLLLLLSLFFSGGAFASDLKSAKELAIDSLNLILNDQSVHDTTRLKAKIEIAQLNRNMRIPFWDSIAKQSAQLEVPNIQANALINIGFINYNKGIIPEALEHFHKALKIYEKSNDQVGMSRSLNCLGVVYKAQGEFDKALEYYSKSLKVRKQLNDRKGESICLNNIGRILESQKKYQEAMTHFQQSLAIKRELNNQRGIALSLNNIGNLYKILAEEENNVSMKDSLLDLALEYHMQSLEIKRAIKNKRGICFSLNNIGSIWFLKGDDTKALSYSEQSLKLAQEINHPEPISNASKLSYTIYTKQNKFKQALSMHELYVAMKDTLINEKNLKATIKQQTEYDYEKKKAVDDIENEKKIALEKQKQKNQFIVLMIVILATVLVMVLLLIIYRRLRITNRQKLVIEHQHTEIQDSISYAKRIQDAILPPASLLDQHLGEHFVFYEPKDVVAGDFYWLEQHKDLIFFAAADCTGHGVPGAMVSVVCHNSLNRAVKEFELQNAGEILDKVRELVLSTFEKSEEQVKDGMDISLCAWNKTNNTLQYSGANNPIYLVKNKELIQFKGTKQPIGYVEDAIPFKTHEINLDEISAIYLSSDGFPDQFGGPKNKKYGYKKFRNFLLDNSSKTTTDQHTLLSSELNSWIEGGQDEQIDDICVLGIKFK